MSLAADWAHLAKLHPRPQCRVGHPCDPVAEVSESGGLRIIVHDLEPHQALQLAVFIDAIFTEDGGDL